MLERTSSSVTYRGGEGQSVFPIPFPFQRNSHLRARVRSPDGVWRTLAQGVDYTVNLVSDGDGELILLYEALADDAVLVIRRVVPLTQDILFHNQGPNSPAAVEEAVDKLTMIAQQLQDGLGGKLEAPEGSDAAELAETLAGSPSRFARLDASVAALQSGKADAGHVHALSSVAGLDAALAGKVGVDDPRLAPTEPAGHAASHAADGDDPVSPAAIGAMAPPPANGKSYLAVAGGWVEYIAPAAAGSEEGGTSDHAQLLNRDAADQHPQSAIRNLPADLEAIRRSVADLADSAAALAASLLQKADAGQLPGPAADDADGLMTAADKVKLSALPEAPALAARLDGLDDAVAPLSNLGGLAAVDDAPADGSAYLRRDGDWVAYVPPAGGSSGGSSSGGGSGGAYPGEIRLMPFRQADLPAGWYLCNGDRFTKTAAPYALLARLSDAFRGDWGMTMNAALASLPNLIGANGGFFRCAEAGDAVGVARTWGADAAGSGFKDYAMIPAIYLGE